MQASYTCFYMYPPEINPEDLDDFFFIFKQSLEEFGFKIPYSKTQGKYVDNLCISKQYFHNWSISN